MTTPRVNLLPHREARRERQKKVFWFMTGLSVVAGLLMIAVVWTVLQGYISNQEARNEFVRAENANSIFRSRKSRRCGPRLTAYVRASAR